MDLIIQLIGSCVLFLNKVFLRRKKISQKRIGWLLGIIGITLITIPVYYKALWVLVGYHTGLASLMIYGYTLTLIPENSISKFKKIIFRSLIVFATLAFCVYLFIETYYSKNFNVLQLLQAITGLSGSLFLAFNTTKSNIIGWTSNIFAHLSAIYLFHQKGLYVIEFFQILSIFVAIKAIKELRQDLPPEVFS